jgi:hypothetical protein
MLTLKMMLVAVATALVASGSPGDRASVAASDMIVTSQPTSEGPSQASCAATAVTTSTSASLAAASDGDEAAAAGCPPRHVWTCCRCSDGGGFCGCRPNWVSPGNFCINGCG